ncbi:MAG: heme lyase CcmF/NrfE family subunit [Xanthomonadales bacterium]|nr:heme lyase CcmF/NrfE family subunit [Gammaproteobacteria bacterium]MBT8053723.1 heme lyase CcmF/NrfE family subunit [Gammaproteobacteria bacterium]NND56736.1 heme lyase CcmF/NrfE family subunit [Xanthomonadales bacterium]NNK50968.1 heme lyase CcmF/NrfE family subunit [Xanthomonadales bacterium]
MIPEIGQVTLIGALLVAILMGTLPLIGASTGNQRLMRVGQTAATAQFLLIATSFAVLTWAFISQDFSVEYVARNSNSQLPMEYRFSAVWGSHEGSLLLWELILCLWTFAVALFSKKLPDDFRARTLAVLGWISTGFLMFVIFTSNPFGRLIPSAADGLDLNPLLQDPGLIIHPPMLYMGYVGFSVSFAFAVAALLGQQVDRDWVRWSRPWTHVAWAFLTLGIALGSWWAYYELGWGGWWFWDPVENASFMPWLVGTALIHSQAVTEKRGAFRNWTLILAITAFSLCLLGTFLVRSGVLTSVHAFASDPTRGVFILTYLFVVVGGSLLLFAIRAPGMVQGSNFAGLSRETLLLVNNLLLVVMTAMVLIGTLYPLLLDALDAGKISVGPPYFGTLFALLLIPLALLLPLSFYAKWQEDKLKRLMRKLAVPAVLAVVTAAATAFWLPDAGGWGIAGSAAAAWIIASCLRYYFSRLTAVKGQRPSRSETGMILAHLGVGVFLIGASLTNPVSSEKHLRMVPGDSFELAGYNFVFEGTRGVRGPNYFADEGEFIVYKEGERVTSLYPQKRRYPNNQVMTEAALDPGLTRDLYVSLGEPLDDQGNAWAIRIYHKPFIRFIWMGALLMMFGGFLAASDRRYRRKVTAPAKKPAGETGARRLEEAPA